MLHEKSFNIWIEDPETGDEREFDVAVTLDVVPDCDVEIHSIDEAEESDFESGVEPNFGKNLVPIDELPSGVRAKIEERLTDDWSEIIREAIDAADDAAAEFGIELSIEARHS